MKVAQRACLVLCVFGCMAVASAAQTPVGALAVDARQGDQYGWAVDYETAAAAGARALGECGSGCSVVLTFERCAAYAADQDEDSTAVGWAESYDSAAGARQRSLGECGSRGGSGCLVRVWGCNGHVVEEGLGLDRVARRQIQQGLEAQGFDPGGADGMFGPRTRTAIRSWQSSRGARPTGYLDGAAVAALRPSVVGQPTFRPPERPGAVGASPSGPVAAAASQPAASGAAAQQATAELEALFWQSIVNSTDPANFEAYLEEFPNGVFRRLTQNRLAALREPANDRPASVGRPTGGVGSPGTGSRVSGTGGTAFGAVAGGDAPRRPGDVFRDCEECPEMVVLPGGGLAMGRYEVTVGEYRAFASATGGGAGGGCITGGDVESWRDPGFPQTDRHPVTCVNWDDAQAYVSWLSRRTAATYRLPTEAEWERAAEGPSNCRPTSCIVRMRVRDDLRPLVRASPAPTVERRPGPRQCRWGPRPLGRGGPHDVRRPNPPADRLRRRDSPRRVRLETTILGDYDEGREVRRRYVAHIGAHARGEPADSATGHRRHGLYGRSVAGRVSRLKKCQGFYYS